MRFQVALALRTGKWPEWATNRPAVHAYLSQRTGGESVPLLDDYGPSLRAAVSPSWAGTSLAHISELLSVAGKPLKTDEVEAIIYCTREERDALLEAADQIRDGVAVWLAF